MRGLILFAALSSYGLAALAQVASPFLVTVTGPVGTIVAGSEVIIGVAIVNTTNTELVIGETSPNLDYTVTIKRTDGRVVQETEKQRRLRDRSLPVKVTRNVTRSIKPGEASNAQYIDVAELYELGNPGEYIVNLQRRVPKSIGDGVVRSNDLRIIVTP